MRYRELLKLLNLPIKQKRIWIQHGPFISCWHSHREMLELFLYVTDGVIFHMWYQQLPITITNHCANMGRDDQACHLWPAWQKNDSDPETLWDSCCMSYVDTFPNKSTTVYVPLMCLYFMFSKSPGNNRAGSMCVTFMMLTGKNKRKLTFLFVVSVSSLYGFGKVSGSHLEVLPRLFISMPLSLFRHFLCIRVLPIPCIFVTTNEGQVGPLWAKIGPLFKSDRTHLQHLDPQDWSSVAPGMAGRPLAHTTNLTTESYIVREFTFDIERLENTRVCKDSWTCIHIEWMLVPLRLLMDGLLQNHSTCGFQIRIPSDRPTRYKHTPTDMQTWGRPSVRTGRALLCLPNGTELMDMSMSTCKNHSHRK